MYSKEEISRLKQEFWTTFGRYLKPVPSAEGLPINWINYKTGVKHLYFRMNAEQAASSISIDITHADDVVRQIYFEHFTSYKKILHEHLQETWDWNENCVKDGLHISQISKTFTEISVYNKDHWPQIISFLKPRIIALDAFWADLKPIFEALG